MFSSKWKFVFGWMFVLSSPALAGVGSSGGGAAIVCPSATDPLASVQMLDLFEGKIRFGFNPVVSNTPAADQLSRVASRLKNANIILGENFSRQLEYLRTHSNELPTGVTMAIGLDVGSDYAPVLPDGCHLEAAAYFETSGALTISSDLLSRMDETNQAALYAHEALYRLAREFGKEKNAEDSRKLVAQAMSDSSDPFDPVLLSNFTWTLVSSDPTPTPAQALVLSAKPKTFTLRVNNPDAQNITAVVSCYDGDNNVINTWPGEKPCNYPVILGCGNGQNQTRQVNVLITIPQSDQCRALKVGFGAAFTSDYPDYKNVTGSILADDQVIWTGGVESNPKYITANISVLPISYATSPTTLFSQLPSDLLP